jgi:hypothetical protein
LSILFISMMHGQANIRKWNIFVDEIYTVKSVLWRVAKLLSYIEDARCLKVKAAPTCFSFITIIKEHIIWIIRSLTMVMKPKHVGSVLM